MREIRWPLAYKGIGLLRTLLYNSHRGRSFRQARARRRSAVKNKTFVILLAAATLIAAFPLFAHHGNSNFDTGKKLELKSTVTEWIWANPHCWLKFDATDEK